MCAGVDLSGGVACFGVEGVARVVVADPEGSDVGGDGVSDAGVSEEREVAESSADVVDGGVGGCGDEDASVLSDELSDERFDDGGLACSWRALDEGDGGFVEEAGVEGACLPFVEVWEAVCGVGWWAGAGERVESEECAECGGD